MCPEKAVFRPSDEAVFTTLGVNTHLFTCEPSELDSLVRNSLTDWLAGFLVSYAVFPLRGTRGEDLCRRVCVYDDDVISFPPQLPLPEEIHWTPGDSKLHDMSAEEVANQLVAFDWELFSCVHEVSDTEI